MICLQLQWEQQEVSCLRHQTGTVQNQELTQELRLTDGMPDIGQVIGAWGQPILRSKEWSNDAMHISGGVMVWVLYLPEGENQPSTTQLWMPFQMHWDFSQSYSDGFMRANIQLRNVDARVISTRKCMVRANVSVLGEALEPIKIPISTPGTPPDGLQLLQKTYPLQEISEAGEKAFLLDEDVPFENIRPEKILCYECHPVVTEQKVLGDKAAFRGIGNLHLVYQDEDGALHCLSTQIPFAQYAELEREYDKEADISATMAVSSLEVEIEEAQLRVKCGLIAQYLIFEQTLLHVVEDAYCIGRELSPQIVEPELPAILDSFSTALELETTLPMTPEQILDVTTWIDQPTQRSSDGTIQAELQAAVQVLYRSPDGALLSYIGHTSGILPIACGANSRLILTPCIGSHSMEMTQPGQTNYHFSVSVQAMATTQQSLRILSGVELGQERAGKEERPTLILKRNNGNSLWELAKQCGSSVAAIREANALETEPTAEQLLLIPVL